MATRKVILTHFPVLTTLVLVYCSASVMGQVSSSNNIGCFEGERQALLKLKDELVDENGRLSSWGDQTECCKWSGVSCDNITNHVTHLNLRAPPGIYPGGPSAAPLRIRGTTISSSLLELRHLTHLDLSFNDFGNSSIPEFIGSFEKLQYLNLSDANLSRQIPWSIGNLSQLIFLDLSSNYGLRSDDLGWAANLGSLRYLDLSYVELGKASNWLLAVAKLKSIKELHLANCRLQAIPFSSLQSSNNASASAPRDLATLDLSGNPGSISSSTFSFFSNFSTSLKSIDFSFNNMTSLDIPAFDSRVSLERIDLSNNKLGGRLPRFLWNMSSLTYLDLSSNSLVMQISEIMSNLSGPVEKNLKYLNLSDNMMTGSLPDLSRFSSLQVLALARNKLNGSIAKVYPRIPSLYHLDLSSNNFTGELPDLTTSPALEILHLHDNKFDGVLDESSIGSLSNLEVLDLASNNFQGMITESHLLNLSRLRILDLSSNPLLTINCSSHWIPPFQLTVLSLSKSRVGRFPQWLQHQKNLKFVDISLSQIADTIPSWIDELAANSWVYLNASNNQIHGVFPDQNVNDSVYWVVLDLSTNKLTGQTTFLCHSKEWILIDLSNNLFSGPLPSCLADSTRLTFLNLANNDFSGEIPSSFGSLGQLSLLNLRNNSFSGGIPASLRNCTELKMIDFGGNRLTGIIPAWVGDEWLSLILLSLRSNDLRGIIPWSICKLQDVQVLDLSLNNISGVVPKCLDNLTAIASVEPGPSEFGTAALYYTLLDAAYFTWKRKEINFVNHNMFVQLIDLSSNALVGDIPSEITKLVGLESLNLSRNSLSGQIPANICLLRYLDSLDLSRNHLSGGIPANLSDMNFLGDLDLSYNNLSGRIPPQLLKFDESTYAGNPGLCGRPILDKSCPGDNEKNPHPGADLEHKEDELITQGFYICMGFGFVIGFWGILGIILINSSARHAFLKLLGTIEDFVYTSGELINKANLREKATTNKL